jgi:hypothetical protein
MGLSRLDNFLKSTRGTILYVDPSSLDATDSIENTGNSLTRPFKTIQRALIESARFSYQRGLDNDRFGKTTILLYPGEHTVDNRPGLIPYGPNQYYFRNGGSTSDLQPFDVNSNFDLDSPNNELYKLNSIHGGVILPRGTSIVGLDLRKTKIRPKYVPDPLNDDIERSALFRLTGACYIWQFSMFDGNPNGVVYKDYTANTFVPNFSHHKLTCFEYADGVNTVNIRDTFLTYPAPDNRTDLDMYYEKVGLVYGQASGRQISPDYPSTGLDIQPKVDEYRIVGSTGGDALISSISSSGTEVTVVLDTTTATGAAAAAGLQVDTPFRIQGISATGYNGQYVVSEKISSNTIKYQVQNAPAVSSPSSTGATLSLSSDTVTSASPYIFNVSLRSVFGMCGVLADGNKATGFKSMVIAQFTGIGLQKDDRAFVLYNQDTPSTGVYDDNTKSGNETIGANSRARYKPEFKNFHVKVTNNSFIQAVSIFAIGYAEHFVTENGGDISLTNSNSNFGANALTSIGFRKDSFAQDNTGYISHIYPPKEVPLIESSLEFNPIDVEKTVGLASTGRLFAYGASNEDVPPENVIEGFRIGARVDDTLRVLIPQGGVTNEYSARIVMDGSRSPYDGVFVEESTSEKSFNVKRRAGINSIGTNSDGGTANVITLESAHNFINGETVRVIGETGQIPDGLEPNAVYNVITDSSVSGITTNTNIKLAKTLNDALNGNELSFNGNGGLLKVVSRVSDKNSGDIGHPVQYIGTGNTTGWYINVSTASTENNIYSIVTTLGTSGLGAASPRTFIKRKNDNRGSNDTLYRVRYVIPKDGVVTSRPPVEGYILQETSTSIGTDTEILKYFGSGNLSNTNDLRNFKLISNATWSSDVATITTELPHNLSVGSEVQVVNVKSTNNTTATQDSGFDRNFTVVSIPNSKQFTAELTTDPGTFTNDTTVRNSSLPYFRRVKYNNTYYVYRVSESQEYVAGDQDGIYYLTLLNASNSPTVTPFTGENYSQPVKRLFPQTDRDNPLSDPASSQCFADSSTIGLVEINDPRSSITRETLDKFIRDADIGVGLTDISSSTGSVHTIHTNIDHGLNRIIKLKINGTGGSDYGTGGGSEETYYNASLVSIGSSTTGTNATAKVTVSTAGTISAVTIMDGGSAYGIGNTMHITGITTSGTSHTPAVVEVEKIYNNVGDVVRVSGVSSESYAGYNDLYRITEVGVGSDKAFTVSSASTIPNTSTSVGPTLTSNAHLYLAGESIKVSSFVYDFTSGIATVNTSSAHGLRVDNKVRITGANNSQYNGSFVVTENVTQTRFKVNVGVSTIAPTESSSNIYVLPEGFTSQDGNVTSNNENIGGRMAPPYAGITTTLSGAVSTATGNVFPITGLNFGTSDIKIGDYLQVDDEIVRVKDTVNPGIGTVSVFRGVLATKATSHALGSVVKRIKPFASELRRHSIIRASGHTFEYVGFGPGNYSTALPDRHDRAISADEELLAQSTKRSGGINFYTGMNDKGISYSGNKKLSTITGREEIFDTPVRTITGEDILTEPAINVVTPVEGIFARSIKVEGGPDNTTISEFNGPIIVNNKVTVNSANGIEANTLFIQGDATVSRNYTVGISAPVLAGNPGNVIWKANPSQGGTWGYVYTTDNEWRSMSPISLERDTSVFVFDKVGVGTTSPGDCTLKVGSGTSLFCVDNDGVGIGTTANGYTLHVIGGANVSGVVTAAKFEGDGSLLTSVNVSAAGWTNITSGTPILYNTDLNEVGIGTSVATGAQATIGAVGSSGTSLHVNGEARFAGIVTANNVTITGFTTVTGDYDIQNSGGQITAGIVTTSDLVIGTALTTSSNQIGVGTGAPRALLDVQGVLRTTALSENVNNLTISGTSPNRKVILDLAQSSVFEITATDGIDVFEVINPPSDGGTFTLKITQDSTGSRAVGIDTFKDLNLTNPIPVYWPGGVVPTVTTTADRTDIYSFKFFNGSALTSVGLYGVIGGQNFS